jgi:hypothetical protein
VVAVSRHTAWGADAIVAAISTGVIASLADRWCCLGPADNVVMADELDDFRVLLTQHDLGFSDALAVLRSHFRQAMSANDNVVRYSHDGRDALMLRFNRKGDFAGIDVGPGLRDDDLPRLLAAFQAPRPLRVIGTVVFSATPVVGRWRYSDCFQIYPMPPEAPRPPEGFGGIHPLMLEVAYNGSDNSEVDIYRAAVTTREVNRLLSGLLRSVEDRLGHLTRLDWVTVLEETDDRERPVSRFGTVGYRLDGAHSRYGPAFTEVADKVPLLEVEPKDEYYARLGFSAQDVLVLPGSFEACLDSYFGLERDEQDKLLRWCHWLNHSRQIAAMSPSAAAIATVQAVEALLPPATPTGECETCGRPIGPSIRERFTRFLEEHAPGEDNAGSRDQLYELRSKLTHGGTLLVGELRHLALQEFVPKSWDQRDLAEQSLRLARLAGANWLLRSSRRSLS